MKRTLLLILGVLLIGLVSCQAPAADEAAPMEDIPVEDEPAMAPDEEPASVEEEVDAIDSEIADVGELDEEFDLSELDDLDMELEDFDW